MKKLLSAISIAAGMALAAGSANAAIALSFTPSSSHINVGDLVSIDVSISGLGAQVLSGYDLNFLYDASVLNWGSITIYQSPFGTDPFSDYLARDNGLAQGGNLGFDITSFLTDAELSATQSDDFLLFNFIFKGMADGVTNFTLGTDPDFERLFVGLDALALDVNVGNACIAVGTGNCQTIPEPGTAALLAIALLGAGVTAGNARRRRQTDTKA